MARPKKPNEDTIGTTPIEPVLYISNRAFRAKVKKIDENGKTIPIANPETGVRMKDSFEEHVVTFHHRGHRMNGAEKLHEFACIVDENTPEEVRDYLISLAEQGIIHTEKQYTKFINPERAIADEKIEEMKGKLSDQDSIIAKMQAQIAELSKG